MRFKLLITLLFILFSIVPAAAQTSPAGRDWKLTYLRGTNIGSVSALLNLDSSGKRFTGNTGCNIMNGTVEMTRNLIKFSAIITTKRACIRDTAAVEGGILSALNRATRYNVSHDRFRIYANTRLMMEFEPKRDAKTDDEAKFVADQLGLEDRKWILDSIAGSAIRKVEEEAFVVFDPVKGSAGGNTSCNVFGGNYSTDGNKISITQTISTMRACIEDERMNIERAFLDGLRVADRFEIRSDKLMLYRRDKLMLTFAGRSKK